MFLHSLDIHIIIEVDDIFLLTITTQDLHVNILYGSLISESVRVLVNNVVESNLKTWLNLTNSVNSRHY